MSLDMYQWIPPDFLKILFAIEGDDVRVWLELPYFSKHFA
jgi:hypothetical protein